MGYGTLESFFLAKNFTTAAESVMIFPVAPPMVRKKSVNSSG